MNSQTSKTNNQILMKWRPNHLNDKLGSCHVEIHSVEGEGEERHVRHLVATDQPLACNEGEGAEILHDLLGIERGEKGEKLGLLESRNRGE